MTNHVSITRGSVSLLLFCLSMASLCAAVVRGPYLQLGTPDAVTVRWRTDVATDSRVCFGTVQGSLTNCVTDGAVTTEHSVRITGLSADTRYYYSAGSSSATLAGNDANHFVVTHPPGGTPKPTRVWVLGDSGTANASQLAVRNAYYNFTGTRHTDLWLMLGDNAYNSGTDSEFQSALFNIYPEMLRKSVLWSTRGNHDNTDGAGSVYYAIHNFPTSGQAGGVASGTEAYYSFDYGNVHFVCLDAFGSSRSATGPMANWVTQDLAANTRQWIVAFWHHPPYSKGSHNSDSEIELIEMRENLLPILEDGGVDLVLCGHSHSYERSFLLDGHYGMSSTLTAAHKKDGGSGREDGTGAYVKTTPGPASHEGAVYIVAGSSGQASGGLLNHPAMFLSLNNLGSVVLDFDDNRLDVKFLRETGVTADYFTMIKGSGTPTPPPTPTGLVATAGNNQVSLSWNASAGATSYNVKRSTTSGGPYTQIATGVTTTSYIDTTAVNGTTYFYVVSAVNAAGESANSAQVSATPQAPPPPPVPTGLAATAGNNQVSLSWNASAGATSYSVKRSTTSGGPYTPIATGVTTTTHIDTTAVNGTTYFYVVSAVNAAGESANSAQVSATPQAPQPPAAPTSLAASAGKKKINLSWTQSSSPNLQFNRIYRSNTSGGPYTMVAQVTPRTTYNDSVPSGATRYYVVTAVNSSGVESAFSNQASATAR